ncbi:Aste57867_14234 [Aphanomyces stellatus]|uniref:Aste57867_14234 protein n=1 Tax=Aphanomyces stellatus TaxID=120398 RepID=A0A485L075_9STRA|nr:hypothetical protein As57867_014183 [Aphanomyces stellatus]VFT91059.1 Aste57867_14234 [Aphanomyces stellatus]
MAQSTWRQCCVTKIGRRFWPNGVGSSPPAFSIGWSSCHGSSLAHGTSTARDLTTATDEATYWRAKHITCFQLQWNNADLADVQLKSLPSTQASSTSVLLNCLVFNDFQLLLGLNRSFIRSANNSLTQCGLQDATRHNVAQIGLFRTVVEPFLSLVLYYVGVPPAWLYDAYRSALGRGLQSESDAAGVNLVRDFQLEPMPSSWANPTQPHVPLRRTRTLRPTNLLLLRRVGHPTPIVSCEHQVLLYIYYVGPE